LPDQNGWSRNLHFEAAWILVLTGAVYVISGLVVRHFRKNLVPAAKDLKWGALAKNSASHYNVVQRLTYLGVIFVLFPMAIWTGLAMSPAIQSILPMLATVCGGQQSARTIHFFVSVLLVLFIAVHITMVCRAGFKSRMRAMVTGRAASQKEQP
jgi:thiosulfate reductase cytochrome b subunit